MYTPLFENECSPLKSGMISTLLKFCRRLFRPITCYSRLEKAEKNVWIAMQEHFPRYKSLLSVGCMLTGTTVLLTGHYSVTLRSAALKTGNGRPLHLEGKKQWSPKQSFRRWKYSSPSMCSHFSQREIPSKFSTVAYRKTPWQWIHNISRVQLILNGLWGLLNSRTNTQ